MDEKPNPIDRDHLIRRREIIDYTLGERALRRPLPEIRSALIELGYEVDLIDETHDTAPELDSILAPKSSGGVAAALKLVSVAGLATAYYVYTGDALRSLVFGLGMIFLLLLQVLKRSARRRR